MRSLVVFLLFSTASFPYAPPGSSVQTPTAPLAAPAPASASTGIAGKWNFVYETEGGDRDNKADFKLAGDQVTGKFGAADVKGTYKDGTLDLAFPFTSDEVGMTSTLKMKGVLKDNKLSGTWTFGDYDGKFTATRAD